MKHVHQFAQLASIVTAALFCLWLTASAPIGMVAEVSGLAAIALYVHAPILYAATMLGVYLGYFALRRRSSNTTATFVLIVLFSLLTIASTLQGAFLEFISESNQLETKTDAFVLGTQYVLALVLWHSLGVASIFVFVGYVRIWWRFLTGKQTEIPEDHAAAKMRNDGS